MKLKELKHNHSLTDLLKVLIFSILMITPLLSVATRCLYVICNKNAYQSAEIQSTYETYNIEYEYTSNEVNNVNDLVDNNIYMLDKVNYGTLTDGTVITKTNKIIIKNPSTATSYNSNTLNEYNFNDIYNLVKITRWGSPILALQTDENIGTTTFIINWASNYENSTTDFYLIYKNTEEPLFQYLKFQQLQFFHSYK